MSYLLFSKPFIKHIKKAAKSEKKTGNGKQTENLNRIAKHAGYQAWNILSKNLESAGIIPDSVYKKVFKAVLTTCPNTADEFILSELRQYLDSSFERLADFSMPDPHTDNGYSHPSIDIGTELRKTYSELITSEKLDLAIHSLVSSDDDWCVDEEDLILEYQ